MVLLVQNLLPDFQLDQGGSFCGFLLSAHSFDDTMLVPEEMMKLTHKMGFIFFIFFFFKMTFRA